MDNKDDNLREMEKIYEEQQREYAEERNNYRMNVNDSKQNLDHKLAMVFRIGRYLLIIIIIFFVVKYEFNLIDSFQEQINEGVKEVNKEEIELHEIKLVGPGRALKVGEEYILTVEYTPSDATNKGVDFVSSDPDIVEVDVAGHIYAKSVGSAKIIGLSKNKRQSTLVVIVEE